MILIRLAPSLIESVLIGSSQIDPGAARILAVWCELVTSALRGPARLIAAPDSPNSSLSCLSALVKALEAQHANAWDGSLRKRVDEALKSPAIRDRVCMPPFAGTHLPSSVQTLGCSIDASLADWIEQVTRIGSLLADGFDEVPLHIEPRFRDSSKLERLFRLIGCSSRRIVLLDSYGSKGFYGEDGPTRQRAYSSFEWLLRSLLQDHTGIVDVGLVTRECGSHNGDVAARFGQLVASVMPTSCRGCTAWVLFHGNRRPQDQLHARFIYTDIGSWMIDPGLDHLLSSGDASAKLSDRLVVRIARAEDERLITRALSEIPGTDTRIRCRV